jgi:hypothetical protein
MHVAPPYSNELHRMQRLARQSKHQTKCKVVPGESGGPVSEWLFVVDRMIELGKVDRKFVSFLREQFKTLDTSGDGVLSDADIESMTSKSSKEMVVRRAVLPPGMVVEEI